MVNSACIWYSRKIVDGAGLDHEADHGEESLSSAGSY